MSFPLGRQTSQDKLAGRKAGFPRGWISPSGRGAQSPLTLSVVAARVALGDEGDREDMLQTASGTRRRVVATPMAACKKGED